MERYRSGHNGALSKSAWRPKTATRVRIPPSPPESIGMKLKNDRYKKNRGGYSRLLEISCEKCGSLICLYQKDGPGNLRRMYVDRIIEPAVLISKKDLRCPKDHLLGVKIIYEKEKRLAFRLFVESVIKKIVKNK